MIFIRITVVLFCFFFGALLGAGWGYIMSGGDRIGVVLGAILCGSTFALMCVNPRPVNKR